MTTVHVAPEDVTVLSPTMDKLAKGFEGIVDDLNRRFENIAANLPPGGDLGAAIMAELISDIGKNATATDTSPENVAAIKGMQATLEEILNARSTMSSDFSLPPELTEAMDRLYTTYGPGAQAEAVVEKRSWFSTLMSPFTGLAALIARSCKSAWTGICKAATKIKEGLDWLWKKLVEVTDQTVATTRKCLRWTGIKLGEFGSLVGKAYWTVECWLYQRWDDLCQWAVCHPEAAVITSLVLAVALGAISLVRAIGTGVLMGAAITITA